MAAEAEEEAKALAAAEAEAAAKAEEDNVAVVVHQSPPSAPAEESTAESVETTTAASSAGSGRELTGFTGLTAGTEYAEARPVLVEAGWMPRELDDTTRLDALDENEQKIVDAGYTELEGCETYARTICRFEYVDGEGKIAAILTAGDKMSVIDAFVMKVR